MADRISALDGHVTTGTFGLVPDDGPGVILQPLPDLSLVQVAGWPDTLRAVGARLLAITDAVSLPGPGKAATVGAVSLLRVEPLKWWLLGAQAPELPAEKGSTLDLSHSRTRVRVAGRDAAALLNRFLSLDLRTGSFPPGSVASSSFHHVGVTLWHADDGYHLFLPRGFALSCWEVMLESALQFGVEVRQG